MKPLCTATTACAAALAASAAIAQGYPTKPVRVIVAVPAGGTPDVLARAVTPSMSALLGQPLVLDNRGGAGGRIAAGTVASVPPDGYTLFMLLNSIPPAIPHVKAGRLRALAVAGGKRSMLLPEIPTVDEATGLRGFQAGSWLGSGSSDDT